MLGRICSQRCGFINFRIISFIWYGQLTRVLPARRGLWKWYEVHGSFAIDFSSVRIAVNVGVGKNHKVGPSQSFDCPGIALLPLFLGQRPRGEALKAVFMYVPAGTNSSPRAGFLH